MLSKASQIVSLVVSKPFDETTAEGRSLERYRRAALTSCVMISARVTNILTGLLLVPITLEYLGADLFGVWMAITSIVTFLAVYDFGVGTGLRNLIIECNGRNDLATARQLIGNALAALLLLACVMIVMALTLVPMLPWSSLIRCEDPDASKQILPAVQACLVMFAIGMPVTQLQNIANGYQRGYWGYSCILLGRVLGFAFVMLSVSAEWPLWVLAAGYIGFPFFVTTIGWIVFLVLVPSLRPWPISMQATILRRLFGVGFFVLLHHLSANLIRTSGLLLIVNTINAASGVPYSVTQRLLGATSVIVAPMVISLSTAVGEAWHRRDIPWIRRTIRRSEYMVLCFSILPLVLLLAVGQEVILIWTQDPRAVPAFGLLLACSAMTCTLAVGQIYSNYLFAMNFVRYVAVTKVIAGVFVVTCGYYTGIVTQSPTAIAVAQVSIGVLVPSLLLWRRTYRLLSEAESMPPQGSISIPEVHPQAL